MLDIGIVSPNPQFLIDEYEGAGSDPAHGAETGIGTSLGVGSRSRRCLSVGAGNERAANPDKPALSADWIRTVRD